MSEIATLGGGCFWCVEAVFSTLEGVSGVQVGYCNGKTPNPTYETVCSGDSGFAEVAQISFDSNIISFEQLLEHFFKTHNPTTLNKQGADAGTQYRSGIFYHDKNQKEVAMRVIDRLNKEKIYGHPIVTEVVPVENYYSAEDYHQDYYKNNQSAPYCMLVIKPKLDKIK
jgi:peptide-methionine (S)-S-oxide reductase